MRKLLTLAFILFIVVDVAIAVYVFIPKILPVERQIITSKGTSTQTATTVQPLQIKITVSSVDPAIKVVSYDERAMFSAFKQLKYFENNSDNQHSVLELNKNNQYIQTIATIKTISFVITNQKQTSANLPDPNLTVTNNQTYPENYDATTHTDTFIIYLSPDQIANLAIKDVSGIYWQAIVYSIASHSNQLGKLYTGKPSSQLNNYLNTIINSYTNQIVINKT